MFLFVYCSSEGGREMLINLAYVLLQLSPYDETWLVLETKFC